jgi:hypothetical protein
MSMYVTISIYFILKLKKAQQQQFLEGLTLKGGLFTMQLFFIFVGIRKQFCNTLGFTL